MRVRGLQSLHRRAECVGPGHRTAVNLVGVPHTEVERGDALVRAGQWEPTRRFDATLGILASLDHEVSRRGAYVAYLGSDELSVKVRVLGAEAVAPGETGLVRLHLPVALPLLPGDRYVLREWGRKETVGGGELLDVAPVRPASKARPDRSVDRVVAERGWVEADLLSGSPARPARRPSAVGGGPDAVAALRAKVEDAVDEAGPLGADVAAFDDRGRAVVATLPDLVDEGGRARRAEAADPLADHPYLAARRLAVRAAPPDGVHRAELRELVRRGLVVAQDGV